MFKTLVNAFKIKDLRNKILITLGLLVLFVVGCSLVCPGFDTTAMKAHFEASASDGFSFFSLMNMINGDALKNCSILALGVSPYITASIVMQLLAFAIPALERISKQGEDGRRKIALYTRIAAFVLALAQAIGIVVSFYQFVDVNLFGVGNEWLVCAGIVLILTAGAMLN